MEIDLLESFLHKTLGSNILGISRRDNMITVKLDKPITPQELEVVRAKLSLNIPGVTVNAKGKTLELKIRLEDVEPVLVEAEPNHYVACHYSGEIIKTAGSIWGSV